MSSHSQKKRKKTNCLKKVFTQEAEKKNERKKTLYYVIKYEGNNFRKNTCYKKNKEYFSLQKKKKT